MEEVSKEKVTKEKIDETLEATKKIKLKLNEYKELYKDKLFTEII